MQDGVSQLQIMDPYLFSLSFDNFMTILTRGQVCKKGTVTRGRRNDRGDDEPQRLLRCSQRGGAGERRVEIRGKKTSKERNREKTGQNTFFGARRDEREQREER